MVNGQETKKQGMIEEFKYGQMVLVIKDTGKQTKRMLKESYYMQMEISMKESG